MKSINTLVEDIYSVVSGGLAPVTNNNKVDVSYDKWFTPRRS